MTRYVGVDDQKAAGFPVSVACEAAGVSTSGYYDWRAREAAGPSQRQAAEAELVELMRDLSLDVLDGQGGGQHRPAVVEVGELGRRCHSQDHPTIMDRRWVARSGTGDDRR